MSEKQTVATIKNAPYNPRKISDEQLRLLGKSLAKFGDLSGIVVNVKTGNLVGGHQRIKHFDKAWPILKEPFTDKTGTVARGDIVTPWGPMTYREVSWSEQMEKAANVAANQHGGDFDIPKLKEILAELNDGEFDVTLTGFSEDDLKRMIDYEGTTEEDDIPAPPKNPITKPGDLIILGEHRLLCGDSTNKKHIEKLMDGEKSAHVLADPPYNIGFKYHGIDDKKSAKNYSDFCVAWFSSWQGFTGHIVTPGPRNTRLYPEPRDVGIWIKKNATAGASCFHLRVAEPILFYGKFSQKRNTDIFDYSSGFPKELKESREKAGVLESHAPAKSMPLWLDLAGMCGENVADPFGGNGTTLLACEKLSKRGFSMEIDPSYCDVIVERWEKLTGKKAKR